MKYEIERQEIHSMGFGRTKKSYNMSLTKSLINELGSFSDKLDMSRSTLVEVAILQFLRSNGAKETIAFIDSLPPKEKLFEPVQCDVCKMVYRAEQCSHCDGTHKYN